MRTRAALTSVFASLGVIVVGLQVGANALPQSTAATTTSTTTTGSSGATTTSGTGAASSGTGASSGTSSSTATTTSSTRTVADGTFTGNSANTPFGSVQVSVTISGGSITDVTALKLTDADGRSRQISNYAAPILANEVVSAQSANVRNVSGATYTTNGYLTSVQSALDQAGF